MSSGEILPIYLKMGVGFWNKWLWSQNEGNFVDKECFMSPPPLIGIRLFLGLIKRDWCMWGHAIRLYSVLTISPTPCRYFPMSDYRRFFPILGSVKLIFCDMCFESGFLLSLCPYYQLSDLPSHPKGLQVLELEVKLWPQTLARSCPDSAGTCTRWD